MSAAKEAAEGSSNVAAAMVISHHQAVMTNLDKADAALDLLHLAEKHAEAEDLGSDLESMRTICLDGIGAAIDAARRAYFKATGTPYFTVDADGNIVRERA
jgi:hypothetical protein